MPSLSEEGEPTDSRRFSFSNLKRRDAIILGVVGVFLFFMLRNIFVRDYNSETRSYLTSIGRKDAIDNVIPKTRQEVILDKARQDKLVEAMASNVTFLMSEYKSLRSEVDSLKAKSG